MAVDTIPSVIDGVGVEVIFPITSDTLSGITFGTAKYLGTAIVNINIAYNDIGKGVYASNTQIIAGQKTGGTTSDTVFGIANEIEAAVTGATLIPTGAGADQSVIIHKKSDVIPFVAKKYLVTRGEFCDLVTVWKCTHNPPAVVAQTSEDAPNYQTVQLSGTHSPTVANEVDVTIERGVPFRDDTGAVTAYVSSWLAAAPSLPTGTP